MLKTGFLNGNALKIIAAVAMLADHIGLLFFPNIQIFRIIGRLAFPIFAFMIAEGCKYTRNKLRYFLTIFGLAFICQLVYYVFDGSLYMCVLVTFSLSITALFSLDNFKRICLAKEASLWQKAAAAWLFAAVVIIVYLLNLSFQIDYGFWGCMLPVFAGLCHMPKGCAAPFLKKLDNKLVSVLLLTLGLVPLIIEVGWVQPYSLFALLPLLLYSGKRGKLGMKYFFYVFYPVHLVVLEGVYILTKL